RGVRAGRGEVRAAAGPHQRRLPGGSNRWVLAQLHHGRRRGDARLRRGPVLRRGVERGELPPHAGREVTGAAMEVVWRILVWLGGVAFAMGALWGDGRHAWAIYLVNLVFWSGLGVTGPAIAGMMQLTEARWSPGVRRIALTTAGFLPISFVLL